MKGTTMHTGVPWLDGLLPEGIPIGTSTLLSGPGGSGKPLIAEAVVAGWLRERGSVVFMPLQYPSTDFVVQSMQRTAGVELGEFSDRIAFIELATELQDMEPPEGHHIRANLVIPDVWDRCLAAAYGLVPHEGPGVLLFASAINLLLFSPTYGAQILDKIELTMTSDERFTALFSASTTARKKQIAHLETVADNLWMTRSEKDPMRIYLQIQRMQGVEFMSGEMQVPFPPGSLEGVKAIADHSRKRVIPQVSKI